MTTSSGAPSQDREFFMFPATSGQRRLWLADQRSPGRATYNIPFATRVAGPLDFEAFKRAVGEVVRRHETLRTHFEAVDGEPHQVIATHLDIHVPVIDLTCVPEEKREEEIKRLVQEEVNGPFDLRTAPLWRVKVFRLREQDHVLVVVLHHSISDGWSTGVLLGEVSLLYSGFVSGKPAALPDLPIQYADFAAWEREMLECKEGQEQLKYWKDMLSGTPALKLPYDRPKTSPLPGKGGSHGLKVEQELADKLRQLGQQRKATLHMTLLAAYQTLLHRYTGQMDIAVGSNIARRTRMALQGQIGFYANVVITRTKLSGEWSFYQTLEHVKERSLASYARQDVPIDLIVQELAAERDPLRPLIFHATFTLQNLPRLEFGLGTMELTPFPLELAPAKHDISVFVTDTGTALYFGVLYNMDLFNKETIASLFEHYAFLLQSIVDDPNLPISKLALCSRWTEGTQMPPGCRAHGCHIPA